MDSSTDRPQHPISRLSTLADGRILGRSDAVFEAPCALVAGTDLGVTWLHSSLTDHQRLLRECRASVIICDPDTVIPEELLESKGFFLVEDPKLLMVKLVGDLFRPKRAEGIHPTAVVDPEARLGEGVSIGPYACIGPAVVGPRVSIGAHSIVAAGVVIGAGAVIHENVHVGSDGFGFVRSSDGLLVKFHHIGSVEIAEDVEIYPFSNIDRGTLGATVIGQNTKIDHYCHIGHNSVVGAQTLITAGVILCGGAIVGDRCWIGPNSVIKEKVRVHDDAYIGLASMVNRDVPAGEVWAGSPAMSLPDLMESRKALRSLTKRETAQLPRS